KSQTSESRASFADLKISTYHEMIGDLAKNIAKRSLVLDESEPLLIARSVETMGRTVLAQLKDVLDAYSAKEVAKAAQVWSRDEYIDAQYNSMIREQLTYIQEAHTTIISAAHRPDTV